MDFKKKYLKYKNKYFELKKIHSINQNGGGYGTESVPITYGPQSVPNMAKELSEHIIKTNNRINQIEQSLFELFDKKEHGERLKKIEEELLEIRNTVTILESKVGNHQ